MGQKKRVVTLGEIMLRLSTPGYQRFVQAEQFDVVYGGGEANVAVSLANYGHDATFVSKLPTHEIGQSAVNHLRRFGVNTDHIARGGDRVGIYFLETGASMRPSKVVYDRANSAISEAEVADFDFDAIFEGADWFHFSGITPALGERAQAVTLAALKAAKKHNVTVSVDLNYRKKLWTPEEAKAVMSKLMAYVDVCIGNEEDAEKVLGFKPGETDVTSGDLEIEGYKRIFKEMKEAFDFKYVVTTLRESHSASDNGWSALIYDGEDFYRSRHYEVRIVDRVGGGDSFAGGLIHGLMTMDDHEKALEFGVAASALKHTIFGDFNLVSEQEVMTLMEGDASGRVQR
jgi:2-dehydro-3-deoxygluconokinase